MISDSSCVVDCVSASPISVKHVIIFLSACALIFWTYERFIR